MSTKQNNTFNKLNIKTPKNTFKEYFTMSSNSNKTCVKGWKLNIFYYKFYVKTVKINKILESLEIIIYINRRKGPNVLLNVE